MLHEGRIGGAFTARRSHAGSAARRPRMGQAAAAPKQPHVMTQLASHACVTCSMLIALVLIGAFFAVAAAGVPDGPQPVAAGDRARGHGHARRSACCWSSCPGTSISPPAAASGLAGGAGRGADLRRTAGRRRSRCSSAVAGQRRGLGGDGRADRAQKIPAFIITLGGLLVFKGLHWLVIRNSDHPGRRGRRAEPLFAADHLLPAARARAMSLAAGDRRLLGLARAQRARKRRACSYGFEVDDARGAFLSCSSSAQLLLLFVLIVNQYRGLPLALP